MLGRVDEAIKGKSEPDRFGVCVLRASHRSAGADPIATAQF